MNDTNTSPTRRDFLTTVAPLAVACTAVPSFAPVVHATTGGSQEMESVSGIGTLQPYEIAHKMPREFIRYYCLPTELQPGDLAILKRKDILVDLDDEMHISANLHILNSNCLHGKNLALGDEAASIYMPGLVLHRVEDKYILYFNPNHVDSSDDPSDITCWHRRALSTCAEQDLIDIESITILRNQNPRQTNGLPSIDQLRRLEDVFKRYDS